MFLESLALCEQLSAEMLHLTKSADQPPPGLRPASAKIALFFSSEGNHSAVEFPTDLSPDLRLDSDAPFSKRIRTLRGGQALQMGLRAARPSVSFKALSARLLR